ncbi:anthranilate synthase component I [Stratiformator vulcanicus]|uniref:Anthranilate synthase component 1 n=1 Tax=Stratiformator vulcanicus TaxID=2527980 RepID=A0A517R308_9PLAN|nr:anthranilate synthase component I [Stratiformator vulcanicus]QDT38265.1 Anthranilate synthase component 1 [Stratiformator vulcanicus]
MTHEPPFDVFREIAAAGRRVPVYRQLIGDSITPVSAYCRLRQEGCSFLFESVVGGEKIGRYSFVGTSPFLTISACGTTVTITEGDKERSFECDDPLGELQQLLEHYQTEPSEGLPRFCGGAVGYAGYDVVRYSEHLPDAPSDDRKLPDMHFALYDRMVIFDQINKTIFVVAHARPAADAEDATAEYRRACRAVDDLCRQLQQGVDDLQVTDIETSGEPQIDFESNFTKAGFESVVERCQEYIRAGDVFQVVVSQRLRRETSARPLDIYRALRVVNPSPFMFLLTLPQTTLIGSSPEIMVRVEEDIVTIRPLAGTRKRGRSEAEDRKLAEELLADPKERAEHVMLIDLARNDVGRVAEFGSIELSDVMEVERYSHVMHITSNVTGRLKQGTTAIDALRAGLPAGTVSGAPKVRAMEIIDEMEPHRRGPYAGAVGYIDFTGHMDTCIALRTIVLTGQTAFLQAGAGLVADSVPSAEYEETLNKAKVLLRAIEVAEKRL